MPKPRTHKPCDSVSEGVSSPCLVLMLLLVLSVVSPAVFLLPGVAVAFMTDDEIGRTQSDIRGRPAGERIAFWAGQFVGTPYDPDPLGEYVRRNVIVADDRVDCMYLVFRAVELALGRHAADARMIALDKRFRGKGEVADGQVLNYHNRFEYGEDMIDSGKWGREITSEIGGTQRIAGSRGRDRVLIISGKDMTKSTGRLRDGDILYFVRNPGKRVSDEIVGHIGIIKKETNKAYLIHASGLKNKGGKVKKTLLTDYLETMPFIGVRVSRFEPETGVPE